MSEERDIDEFEEEEEEPDDFEEDIDLDDVAALDEDLDEALDDPLETGFDTDYEEVEEDEDEDEDDDETAEALDELEAEELELLDEEAEDALLVDEAAELRAIRREELTLNVDAQAPRSDEFVCRSCFLVKRTSQLANRRKMICRDCAD